MSGVSHGGEEGPGARGGGGEGTEEGRRTIVRAEQLTLFSCGKRRLCARRWGPRRRAGGMRERR